LAAGRLSTLRSLGAVRALVAVRADAGACSLNRLTLLYAVGGAFIAVTYPFVKRFLSVPQMYLGLAFGAGIPMAFRCANRNGYRAFAWLLLLANVLWVTVLRHHVRHGGSQLTTSESALNRPPILFGDSDRHIIAVLMVMTLASLYLVGKNPAPRVPGITPD